MAAPVAAAGPYLAPNHSTGGGLMCQGDISGSISTKNNLSFGSGTVSAPQSGSALDLFLDNMVAWYTHVHSDGSNYQGSGWVWGNGGKGASASTLATKLVIDRAFYAASQYRNGTYASQADDVNDPPNGTADEAAYAETNYPLGIAVFWGGNYKNSADTPSATDATLNAGITIGATTLAVIDVDSADRPTSPNTQVANTTWPFRYDTARVQTGVNAHSIDTKNYVPWIRIDDEIMILTAVPTASAGIITLTVRRGQWGTTAIGHSSGAKVLSPVYIGTDTIGGITISGSPQDFEDNATIGHVLRYAMNMASHRAHQFLIDRITSTFWEGHNAVWLDVSSSFQFNQRDAWDSNPSSSYVRAFDPHAGLKVTNTAHAKAQRKKTHALRLAFPGKKMIGNNLGESNLVTTNLPLITHTYDLSAYENFMIESNDVGSTSWVNDLNMVFEASIINAPALVWARWNTFTGLSPADHTNAQVRRHKMFTYACFLLAYRLSWTKGQFGGTWAGGNYASDADFKPDPLFFFDLGAPVGSPTAVSQLAYGTATGGSGLKLYVRHYAKGIVVVNPNLTGSALNFTLPSNLTWYSTTVTGTTAAESGAYSVPIKDSMIFVLDAAQTRTVTPAWTS